MNFLLKITDGPMKGAEIALVPGTRLSVGSSDECDIVLADASLGAKAFELDVAEGSVTMITPDGAQRQLEPFEVCDFGTSAVAIGPADGPWGELKRAAQLQAPAAAAPAEEAQAAQPAEEEKKVPPAEEPARQEGEGGKEEEKKKGGCLGCILSLALLALILAAAAWLLWQYCPPAREFAQKIVASAEKAAGRPAPDMTHVEKAPSLSEIAREHGLELSGTNGVSVLKGNLRRRTERLAIRALANAAEPGCRFEVTDDETMLANSKELLFAYTEGAIDALAASNRTVVLRGYAPSPAALERALRALDMDVKGIEKVDTSRVSVGGTAPAEVAESAFVKEEGPVSGLVKKPAKPVQPGRSNIPIAGILTVPYPCVVMQNGHRIMEGAQVGAATLVKIEAERLVLSEGDRTFEWRP